MMFFSSVRCLNGILLEESVYGLNATIPESVKDVIKPWNERDDEARYVESNVDDQVGLIPYHKRALTEILIRQAHDPHSFHGERAHQIYVA